MAECPLLGRTGHATKAEMTRLTRPKTDIGRIEIPQRSSLPRRGGMLYFRLEAREDWQ
jgi:hypothetical protein